MSHQYLCATFAVFQTPHQRVVCVLAAQVCRERCELMASGRLTQLSAAAQRCASPLSWEPRDRLELQRTPVSHLTAVDRLPDEQIARCS